MTTRTRTKWERHNVTVEPGDVTPVTKPKRERKKRVLLPPPKPPVLMLEPVYDCVWCHREGTTPVLCHGCRREAQLWRESGLSRIRPRYGVDDTTTRAAFEPLLWWGSLIDDLGWSLVPDAYGNTVNLYVHRLDPLDLRVVRFFSLADFVAAQKSEEARAIVVGMLQGARESTYPRFRVTV